MMLIEIIVYIALFSFMMVVTMSSIVQLWHLVTKYHKKSVALINLTAAHDLFVDDVRHAPTDLSAWKVTSPTELIWQQFDGTHRGWLYEKNSLFRIEGTYTHRWYATTKNIVAADIKKIAFCCHLDKKKTAMTRVDISLEDDYHTIDAYAVPLQQLLYR